MNKIKYIHKGTEYKKETIYTILSQRILKILNGNTWRVFAQSHESYIGRPSATKVRTLPGWRYRARFPNSWYYA